MPARELSRGEPYTEAVKAACRHRFGQTPNLAAVAAETGVSARTLSDWVRAAGMYHLVRPGRAHPRRDEYHRLRLEGFSRAEAAQRVGASARSARNWDRQSAPNGYNKKMHSTFPDPAAPATHRQYLNAADRLAISDLLRRGCSYAQIAAELGRSRSTISREVTRNSHRGLYHPYLAHQQSVDRRARPKPRKLVPGSRIFAYVWDKLQLEWSPEQISGKLAEEFPEDQEMRVCHETIYQALYLQARGGLKREVQAALRTGRAMRKPAGDQRRSRSLGGQMVMISQRPAEVEDRAVPGHWEGDLIIGAGSKSAIATLVERHTRFVMLCHLPGDHTAQTVAAALTQRMKMLPEHLRGSLTWDQGAEMAAHHTISVAADLPIYFCDPASPWQRGSNENTNGLLRQYFPKGTDLSVHGPEDLELVANKLNGRPRKTLGWDSPADRMKELLTTS